MNQQLKRVSAISALAIALASGSASGAGASSVSQVQDALSTLSGDMTLAKSAAQTGDIQGVSDACSMLYEDASSAVRLHRPSRIPKRSWSHAHRGFVLEKQAAVLCQSGADTGDANQIDQATAVLDQATSEFSLATAALQ
jgi:hypothetical protein